MMCRTRLICRLPLAGQPVPDLVAGGGVEGCGAVPGREVGLVREPGDVADLDQQPGGAGGADAVQVEQTGAGGFDQLGELLVGGLLPGIDPLQVSDQLGGDPAAGLADDVAGPDLGQQCLGLAPRTGPASPRRGSARAAAGAAGRPCGCGPRPASGAGRPGAAGPRAARRSTTGRSPLIRVPTRATECASVASVLRPWPVANTRARADSLGGTSMTSSPSSRSRTATCLPIPAQPSIAQTRSANRWRSAASRHSPRHRWRTDPRRGSSRRRPSPRSSTDRLCGSIPITTRLLLVCHQFLRCSLQHWLSSREGNAASSWANPS